MGEAGKHQLGFGFGPMARRPEFQPKTALGDPVNVCRAGLLVIEVRYGLEPVDSPYGLEVTC